MGLTEHFTLAEMCKSETATRLGINNNIPEELKGNVLRVAEALEKVRAHYGAPVHVTSCYRSPELNKAVGGSLTSAHRFALAADFEVSGVENIEVCKVLPDIIKDYDQIIYEFGPSGWVHLGFAKVPRYQKLSAIKRDGKTIYLPGFVKA
jgi:hypothetical protein